MQLGTVSSIGLCVTEQGYILRLAGVVLSVNHWTSQVRLRPYIVAFQPCHFFFQSSAETRALNRVGWTSSDILHFTTYYI
jgi:hypothetical protein